MNQKGFANIILIVFIVLLVGSVVYLVFVKSPDQSTRIANQPSFSTAISTPLSPSTTKDIDLARETLFTYFKLLKTKQYGTAVEYHGGGYDMLQDWNPYTNPNDHVALLTAGCESNGWQCIAVENILHEEQLSQSEFKFIVQFEKPEWSTGTETVFTQGPCCGTEDTGQRKTDFEYLVIKMDDTYTVATPPVYVP